MRYLNKIVFLNSAHIPYAEVKLDGNVHFIGTQGVGKSTVLRALLFFYNADKLRLGIPKEKQGFDAFYFPFDNSYVVYEVMREHGAYCVLTTKSQGRAAFRFIDAPFRKEWFINERNEVFSEWGRIHERMGTKVSTSKLVTSYEDYRDVIFGNNRRPELTAFRKYAIVESSKYQNIPRTIQNVFLNSKLEADFIKDTIIHSMSDEELSIDLNYYREQTRSFEQEYTDVMKWFETNKQGEVVVRKQADKVMNSYRELLYTRRQIADGYAELNYAEKQALTALPQRRDTIAQTEGERERVVRLIGELQQKYTKERDALKGEIAVLTDWLKKCREKQLHYEQLHIEEIVQRVNREENWLREQEQLRALKAGLTRAYDDVMNKYTVLYNKVESDCQAAVNQWQAKWLAKQNEAAERQTEWIGLLHEEEERVRAAYEEKLQAADTRLQQLRDEQAQENLRLQQVNYSHPYEKETTAAMALIRDLNENAKEVENNIGKQQAEIARLRDEAAWKRKDLEHETALQLSPLQTQQKTQEDAIHALEALIEKRKGSLAEWLEQHKPGWQATIGKVVDEEQVLYNNRLQPSLQTDGTALFGVSINLSAIDHTVRTPEEMRQECDLQKEEFQRLIARIRKLSEEGREAIEALEKRYSKQVRNVFEALHLLEAEQLQLPAKLKNARADLVAWQGKEAEEKRVQTEAINQRKVDIAHRLYQAEEEKTQTQAEQEKQLKACRKDYRDRQLAMQREQEAYKAYIKEEQKGLRRQADEQKQDLQQAQAHELAGKGADTATIARYDTRLGEVAKELEYIKTNQPTVVLYERDKVEWFEAEPNKRSQRKGLEEKLAGVDERYAGRKEKLSLQQKEVGETLAKLKQDLADLEEGLKQVDEFREGAFFRQEQWEELTDKSTYKSCTALVSELKSLIFSKREKTDEFKRLVNLFSGNFSVKNTFHFRTELREEADYFDFASNLCEFVDNNKIDEYQRQISERYTDIIRRISKEVGDLTRHESEIQKTINAINRDFVERNFAGVIKEISLRSLPSSDKLMRLLLKIKEFCDENQQNLGAVDLFSQASREEVNAQAVKHLLDFMKNLLDEPWRKLLELTDTFNLEFRVKENDNDTGWTNKIMNVGSDGTDILVKAMVNIMLINVFKVQASRKFGDFKLHCMMDEIGKLHPNNVKGILDFANSRNILLINSSPTTYNVVDYRYTYLLTKDGSTNTQVVPLLTYNQQDGTDAK